MKHFCIKLFILVILLLSSLDIYAQQAKIDSLVNKLRTEKDASVRVNLKNKISGLYLDINPDSSLKIANEALVEARELKLVREEVEAMGNSAAAFVKKGNGNLSFNLYREALSMLPPMDADTLRAHLLLNLGVVFYHQAEYDSALAKYFDALDIYEEAKSKKKQAVVLNNIGNVYYFMPNSGERGEAAEYYTEALEIYEELNDKEGLAKQYGNLGLIYGRNKEWDKALEYSQKSLDYYKQTKKKTGIATSYVNLGYVFMETKDYNRAVDNVNKSLALRQEIGDKKGIVICTSLLGSIYVSKGEYQRGKTELLKATKMSQEMGLRTVLLECLENLADAETKLGNYKAALDLYNRASDLKDSIYDEELTSKMVEIESRNKMKEQEYAMNILKMEKDVIDHAKLKAQRELEIKQLKLQEQNRFLYAGGIIIVFLWIILGISYWAYRNKMKTNLLLEQRNKEIMRQKQEIMDSINYAQTIQNAILPPESLIKSHLFNSFVFFRPKDVVSGDFYWMESVDDRIYFAAVDCTGHGVPGAFMSIIGNNCLGQSIKEFGLRKPSDILDKMVVLVTESLRRDANRGIKDGMDMALCCYHYNDMKLEYAGAYNPLYIVRQGELIVYKADRQPVGPAEIHKPFTNHEINLERGDSIYLFSDGFPDQFGGPDDKKFSSKQLRQLLIDISYKLPEDQYKELDRVFASWKGEGEQTDDVTIMGVMV